VRWSSALFAAAALGCASGGTPDVNHAASSSPSSGPGTASQANSEPSADLRSNDRPRFAWHVPVSVSVREHTERSGHRGETDYFLDICPSKDGKLTVLHRRFRVLSLDGIPATDKRFAPTLERLAPLMAAIAVFVVTSDGRFVDVRGLEVMLGEMRKVFPREKVDLLRSAFSNPAQLAILKEAVAFRWRAWVEAWLFVDPAEGTPQTLGASVGDARRELYLRETTPSGRARLASRLKLDPKTAKPLVADLMREFERDPNELDGIELSAEDVWEIETDWPLIRPWRVRTQKTVRVTSKKKSEERAEVHDFSFDWIRGKDRTPECTE
jgi:hypothetical protein